MQNKNNQQSQGNKSPSNRGNRRPNRKNNRKRNNTGRGQSVTAASGQKSKGQNNGNSKGHNRNNNNKKRRRRNSPNLSPEERIFRKYDHLMEVHGHARKKYFEMYHRADPRQKDKLYRNYTRTLEEVHKFEKSLKEEEVEIFRSRHQNLSLDTTYTRNHSLDPLGDKVNYSEEFPDPHYLQSQQESSYQDDTEESVGTMDDYNAYKGL